MFNFQFRVFSLARSPFPMSRVLALAFASAVKVSALKYTIDTRWVPHFPQSANISGITVPSPCRFLFPALLVTNYRPSLEQPLACPPQLPTFAGGRGGPARQEWGAGGARRTAWATRRLCLRPQGGLPQTLGPGRHCLRPRPQGASHQNCITFRTLPLPLMQPPLSHALSTHLLTTQLLHRSLARSSSLSLHRAGNIHVAGRFRRWPTGAHAEKILNARRAAFDAGHTRQGGQWHHPFAVRQRGEWQR